MSRSFIVGSLCKDCKRVIVPPRENCPYCGKKSGPMELLNLDNKGSVQSFTTLQMPPDGFQAPLPIALVELEHGALILCIAKDGESKIKIGDQVEVTVDADERFRYQLKN